MGAQRKTWPKAMQGGHCPSVTASVPLSSTDVDMVICLLELSLINFHNLKPSSMKKVGFCHTLSKHLPVFCLCNPTKTLFESIHSAFKW